MHNQWSHNSNDHYMHLLHWWGSLGMIKIVEYTCRTSNNISQCLLVHLSILSMWTYEWCMMVLRATRIWQLMCIPAKMTSIYYFISFVIHLPLKRCGLKVSHIENHVVSWTITTDQSSDPQLADMSVGLFGPHILIWNQFKPVGLTIYCFIISSGLRPCDYHPDNCQPYTWLPQYYLTKKDTLNYCSRLKLDWSIVPC